MIILTHVGYTFITAKAFSHCKRDVGLGQGRTLLTKSAGSQIYTNAYRVRSRDDSQLQKPALDNSYQTLRHMPEGTIYFLTNNTSSI